MATACFAVGIYYINYASNMYNAYKQWNIVEYRGYEENDMEKLNEFHLILIRMPGSS